MTHDPEQEQPPEILGSGPERAPSRLAGVWRRRSTRGRAVIAGTTVAVLALGGTVAYAATNGDSSRPAAPSAAPSGAPSGAPKDRDGLRFGWFGLGGAVHGEATVKDGSDWVVRVWQRGTVEQADGGRLTVKSDDGTSWTWTLGKDVKDADGAKKGDTVSVVGTRDGDTRTADRVLTGSFTQKWEHRFGGPRDHGTPDPARSGGPVRSDSAA
ncbi:hypothetical protein ABZX85_21685 [Streptomyces sp. NPDC004539]|uniref:hypothetical protein n=1 Tax=Streptomyces sp. NPDC004539 TaxID=3154280 RepID=UPI00339F2878